jgi:adhesin transport system outer membrane protein
VFASHINSLSIFEVVERVVNNSPELRVIFEKKDQAISDYKDARSSYLPKIYFLFNREYSKVDPIISSTQTSWNSINKFQLLVEQKLFDMEQTSKILKYSQVIQSSEFENQKLLESIIQLSVQSYYDVIQAEYLVSIYKEYLRQVREVEKITLNMRQQGDANLGDVNLVQSRLASANSNFLLYQANLDKSKLKLSYLLNLIDKNQLADYKNIFPDLTNKDFYDLGDRIVSVIPVSPEELIDQVLNNNLDILIIRSGLCVAGYDLETQRARYLPQVSAQVELKSEEDRAQNTYSRVGKFNIEARYTIYDGGSRSAANKKFESSVKQAQYNYDILIRDVSDQSYSTLNQLKSYEQQRVSILKEIEAAEEVDRVYNIQFQFANRTLTDRLDNLERLTNARSKLVQMDYSILSTRLQILSLMGMFVEFFGFQNYLEASRLKLC